MQIAPAGATSALGQRIRCRQCTAELIVNLPAHSDETIVLADVPDDSAKTPSVPVAVAKAASDDIPLAPIAESSHDVPSAPSESDDYHVGPPPLPSPVVQKILRQPPPPDAPPPDTWVKPPARLSLGWTFFSGVFTYFFHRNALIQWIVVAAGTGVAELLFLLSVSGLVSGSQTGALQAGCLGIAGFIIGLLAYSYAAACLLAIVESTAYHLDRADDWPEADWRERLWHLMHVVYLLMLAGMVAAAIGGIASLAPNVGWPVFAVIVHFLFPIFLLSSLEADSAIWPVSAPIWRSLLTDGLAWLLFYILSGALWAGWFFAALAIFVHTGLLAPMITAPLWAAALFTYARLLGRLAAYIMHLENKRNVAAKK